MRTLALALLVLTPALVLAQDAPSVDPRIVGTWVVDSLIVEEARDPLPQPLEGGLPEMRLIFRADGTGEGVAQVPVLTPRGQTAREERTPFTFRTEGDSLWFSLVPEKAGPSTFVFLGDGQLLIRAPMVRTQTVTARGGEPIPESEQETRIVEDYGTARMVLRRVERP